MIELEQVRKVFTAPDGSQAIAVDDVSVKIEEGEVLCLIGTSGCGKTTTMKLINRLIEPTSGKVLVGGQDVRDVDLIKLRRSIGYVIQKGGLFPHMTVFQNLSLLPRVEGWTKEDTVRRVGDMLELVNMPVAQFGERYPAELSGGQRQRVGVARGLVLDPAYVLMDEPFGALDPITRDQIHQEFLDLKQRVRKTIIIVTHDMAEAFKLGDRVALMDAGKILQIGAEADFRANPANEFVEEFLKEHMHAHA